MCSSAAGSVTGIEVASSKLALVASDHLPVLVEMRLGIQKPAREGVIADQPRTL